MNTPSYEPMDERQRANVQSIIDQLAATDAAIGSWTAKSDNRQSGFTYYAKYEKKVDVMETMKIVSQFERCPSLLADACRKLLAADAALNALSADSGGHNE